MNYEKKFPEYINNIHAAVVIMPYAEELPESLT